MNVEDQECKDCKYRKLSLFDEPCKSCHWEGGEVGYTYWEPAEVLKNENSEAT